MLITKYEMKLLIHSQMSMSVEVWEFISNFILYFTRCVIIYSCSYYSLSVLGKEALVRYMIIMFICFVSLTDNDDNECGYTVPSILKNRFWIFLIFTEFQVWSVFYHVFRAPCISSTRNCTNCAFVVITGDRSPNMFDKWYWLHIFWHIWNHMGQSIFRHKIYGHLIYFQ